MTLRLIERLDRAGSNFISMVAQLSYAQKHNLIPVGTRWKDSHIMVIEMLSKLFPIAPGETIYFDECLIHLPSKTVIMLKQDLISYFRENLKTYMLFTLEKLVPKYNITLPWASADKILAIHLRLDDEHRQPDIRYIQNTQIVIDLINKDQPFVNGPGKYFNSGFSQAIMAEHQVLNLIQVLKERYPDHQVHIVTSPKGVCNITGYPIHRDDENASLWYLINSDILVSSRSNYGMMAGMLHKGSQVYQLAWGHGAGIGLGTKYDQSGWILIDDASETDKIKFLN